MSPGGVANDNSVTLTLADAQGMLEGVTLNLNPQVTADRAKGASILKQPLTLCDRARFGPQGPPFPAMLGDSGLSGQTSSGQQVILVSHHSQSDTRAPDNGFSVSVSVSSAWVGRRALRSDCGIFVCEQIACGGPKGGKAGQLGAASRYQCYDCNHVCQNANALRRHCRQAHGRDRCHICPVCDKAFKRATHLKVGRCRHMLEGCERNLKCPFEFKTSSI